MNPDNKPFVLKYLLPDSTLAGYHADSICSITPKKERAKVYNTKGKTDAARQVETVRHNLGSIWASEPTYRTKPEWKGHDVGEIQIVIEIV